MQRLPNPPDWKRSEACHRQAARWQLLTSGLHQEQACRDSCMIGRNIKQQASLRPAGNKLEIDVQAIPLHKRHSNR